MKLLERSSPKEGAAKPMGHPTPIRISKRTAIVVALAILATLVLVLWAVPSVLISVVGGFGLALVLSFPVRTLSRWMPREIAILVSFLGLFGLVLLAILILVPLLVVQAVALASALPDLANNAQRYLLAGLELLDKNGLLPGTTDQVLASIGENLSGSARDIAGSVLGGTFGVVSGTFSFALSLFGVVFVSAYMLIDVRRFKTAYLRAFPAVIVAFTVSPTAVILTVIVFVVIQQLEGNFLMPKIQGQSLHVHPVLVFLSVIIGGGLAGLVGVLLAVPTLAMLRVLFDFFRARLRIREVARVPLGASEHTASPHSGE